MKNFIIKQAPWYKGTKRDSWYISCVTGGYLLASLNISDNCTNGGWYATRKIARNTLREYKNKHNLYTFIGSNKSNFLYQHERELLNGYFVYTTKHSKLEFLTKDFRFSDNINDCVLWYYKKDAVEAQQKYLAGL